MTNQKLKGSRYHIFGGTNKLRVGSTTAIYWWQSTRIVGPTGVNFSERSIACTMTWYREEITFRIMGRCYLDYLNIWCLVLFSNSKLLNTLLDYWILINTLNNVHFSCANTFLDTQGMYNLFLYHIKKNILIRNIDEIF